MELDWAATPLLIAVLVVATVIWLRRTLQPRLLIEDAQGEPSGIASYLPSLISDELELLRREGAGNSLRLATGPDEPLALPDTILAEGSTKLLTWLVALLPRPTHVVHLRLIAGGSRGYGLVVGLSAPGRPRASAVLWDQDYTFESPATAPPVSEDADEEKDEEKDESEDSPPDEAGEAGASAPASGAPESYHRLALAAGAWLAYKLPTRDPRARYHALLSGDWQSYAHFRVGAASSPVSRQPYVRALRLDPRNRGALHNLAVLDGTRHCYGPALHRLSATIALLGDEGRERDRLWYRARFNLAVAAFNYVLDARLGYPLHPECLPPEPDDQQGLAAMAVEALRDIEAKTELLIAETSNNQELTRQGTLSEAGLSTFLRDMREVAQTTRADVEALARVIG